MNNSVKDPQKLKIELSGDFNSTNSCTGKGNKYIKEDIFTPI